jgi:SAM-dependent methyltransferase
MNEHVFKEVDGALKFVGDFEGLYASENDPWRQSGEWPMDDMATYYRHSRRSLLKELGEYVRRMPSNSDDKPLGIEYGCGLGYVTEMMRRSLRARMVGLDISSTAVFRASELHPKCNFIRGDLTGSMGGESFDFAVVNQMLWYIAHEFYNSLGNAARTVKKGGLLVINQAFPRKQRYRPDLNFNGLLKLLCDIPYVQVIGARYDDTDQYCHHDGLVILRKC